MNNYSINRRSFIKAAAAVTGASMLTSCVTLRSASRRTLNDKIQMGFIGVGWQGNSNLDQFLNINDCRVLAIADVDKNNLNGAVNKVNNKYQNKDCTAYSDFRELLARKDLDAVCISTPDHWHSIPAIMAAEAGMDIFCEKPLSHTLSEGIKMVEAVSRNKRIWQTGSWQRSQGLFRWAAEIAQNGYLGKITRVEVGLPSGHADFGGTGNSQPDSNPPDHVDYNFWIGPSEMMPFNICRFHKNWRWCYNTGGGQLMDWIGHHCDIAHWGLANPEYGCGPDDQIGPMEVSATSEFPPKEAVWNTATKFKIECKYPNNIDLVISGGHPGIDGGAKWIGPNGWLRVDRGQIQSSNPDYIREIQEREKKGDLKHQLYKSPGHWQEFIDSVKSRKRTLTPVEIAHRSQTPGHLGYIASVTGRKINWDAGKQKIKSDSEATALMSKKMRDPWRI